jgi:hypothetical protein
LIYIRVITLSYNLHKSIELLVNYDITNRSINLYVCRHFKRVVVAVRRVFTAGKIVN